jgi:ankyrin repeat protein
LAHASIFCRTIGRRTCRSTPARRVDLVYLLLEHGAEVNSTTAEGWTPLHLAAHGGFLELAERFLSRGASIEAQAGEGRTPLDLAAQQGQAALVTRLRAFGAA